MAEEQQNDPVALAKRIELLEGKIDTLQFILIELVGHAIKNEDDLLSFRAFLDALIHDATEPASWVDTSRPYFAGPFEQGRQSFASALRNGLRNP